jgi:hypothetical protein
MAKVTQQDLVPVHLAAELLKVSPDTIRRWHKKGLIKAIMGPHGERLFSKDEITRVNQKGSSSDKPWKVLSAPKSKLTSIELFCGAGGLALGMHNAGINSRLLVDFDKDSIKTLQQNRPKWESICASVLDIDLDEYEKQIDIMAGGFPCQAFSISGKQGGFKDPRGTLFFEIYKIAKHHRPKLLFLENVKNFARHDNGNTFKAIKYHLEKVVKQTAEQKTIVDKLREDLIKKYGTQDGENFSIPLYTNEVKDEDGKIISADMNPAYVTFNNEFIKLLEQSVDIKIKEFTIEDFKDIKSKDYPKVLLSLLDDEA